jgi:hypothetical protein
VYKESQELVVSKEFRDSPVLREYREPLEYLEFKDLLAFRGCRESLVQEAFRVYKELLGKAARKESPAYKVSLASKASRELLAWPELWVNRA